ncbi:MAG: tyrosine-type recombinase/integrase [Candidatus Saccharibacteria bacterium]|nr:tyrosine-type recombinase/integrase [Pseudorhodobacter sp.]
MTNKRDLALFNTAIDSRLRGCDLVGLKVRDVFAAGHVKDRASVMQSTTGKPVRFELTETTRQSLERWIADPEMTGSEFLWPSRLHASPHLSTRQYARIMREWVTSIGLEPSAKVMRVFKCLLLVRPLLTAMPLDSLSDPAPVMEDWWSHTFVTGFRFLFLVGNIHPGRLPV